MPSNEIVFAPDRECTANDPHPILEFSNIKNGDVITSPLIEVRGSADASAAFRGWSLEMAHIDDPGNWILVVESRQPVRDGTLAIIDLSSMPNGLIVLRLRVAGPNDAVAEKLLQFQLQLPNPPTDVPTPRPTRTPVPPTDAPTKEPPPTDTPIPPTDSPTETPTPTPTEIPPTETETPSPTPTETPTATPT
jgi:hypothetical protein